jgi:hypothetical protein
MAKATPNSLASLLRRVFSATRQRQRPPQPSASDPHAGLRERVREANAQSAANAAFKDGGRR